MSTKLPEPTLLEGQCEQCQEYKYLVIRSVATGPFWLRVFQSVGGPWALFVSVAVFGGHTALLIVWAALLAVGQRQPTSVLCFVLSLASWVFLSARLYALRGTMVYVTTP